MKKKKKKKFKWVFDSPHFNFRNISLGLVAVTFLANANTLGHQYVLDDAILISENSITQRGISSILEIFKHDTFYGFFETDGKANLVSGGRYRPLSQVLFALEYSVFGLNPFWGHLFNVLYYCLCTFSVLFFIYFILGDKYNKKEALIIASAGAFLFALHPVHTEVVANIKGRDEILALLLCLWAGYFAIRGAQTKTFWILVVSGTIFFLAMLSKEVSVGFLGVIPLGFFLLKSDSLSKTTNTLVPLMVGFSCYLLLRFSVLGFSFGESPPMELMNNPFLKLEGGQYREMTTLEKVPQIIYGLGKYIQLSVFPHPLTHDYYPQHLRVDSILNGKVLLSLLSLVLIIGWALFSYRKHSIIFFSIFIFLFYFIHH